MRWSRPICTARLNQDNLRSSANQRVRVHTTSIWPDMYRFQSHSNVGKTDAQFPLSDDHLKPNLVLCWAAVGGLIVLPHFMPSLYGLIAMSVGSAGLFATFYWVNSESLRGRDGSLWLARCLVTTLWLFAFGITFASVYGWIN